MTPVISDALLDAARIVLSRYRSAGQTLALAESCTGGLVAAALTAHPGASHVLEAAYVAYSADAKARDLAVPRKVLHDHGPVSEPAARHMAEGARHRAGADVALAVTGYADAGPEGDLPAGRVLLAVATGGDATRVAAHRFNGGRAEVRAQAAEAGLRILMEPAPP